MFASTLSRWEKNSTLGKAQDIAVKPQPQTKRLNKLLSTFIDMVVIRAKEDLGDFYDAPMNQGLAAEVSPKYN